MITRETLLFLRPYRAPESELLEIQEEDFILYGDEDGNLTPGVEDDYGEL